MITLRQHISLMRCERDFNPELVKLAETMADELDRMKDHIDRMEHPERGK